MFAVGDKIAYPMHGAGIIEAIEECEILGKREPYFILRFISGQTTVKVPVSNGCNGGMRQVISNDQCNEVLQTLSGSDEDDGINWNKRYRLNMDKIKSGDIMEVAQVVRTLSHRDRNKGLSTGERKMLATARQILVSELMLASGKDEENINSLVEQIV